MSCTKTQEAKAQEDAKVLFQWIEMISFAPEQGEWFWGVNNEYSLMEAEDKIGFWECPNHNARACQEVVHRCDRLTCKR